MEISPLPVGTILSFVSRVCHRKDSARETSSDWIASSHLVPQMQLLEVCVQQVQLHSPLASFARTPVEVSEISSSSPAPSSWPWPVLSWGYSVNYSATWWVQSHSHQWVPNLCWRGCPTLTPIVFLHQVLSLSARGLFEFFFMPSERLYTCYQLIILSSKWSLFKLLLWILFSRTLKQQINELKSLRIHTWMHTCSFISRILKYAFLRWNTVTNSFLIIFYNDQYPRNSILQLDGVQTVTQPLFFCGSITVTRG